MLPYDAFEQIAGRALTNARIYDERSHSRLIVILSDSADGSACAGIAAGHRRQPVYRMNNTAKSLCSFNALAGHGR